MREIIIAAGGKSEYKIAVPQNASQPEMFAARELQKYIAEASGASLPIAEEGGAGSLFISVGNTRAFAALGIALDEKTLNYDGFVIKTAGRCVYIAAACGRGVVYGACDFAERFLGVKFLSPGETLVPACDKVVIGETDILEKPVFRFRNFYDGGLFFTNQNPAYADTLYGVHRRMYSDYSPVRPEWGYGAEWYKEIRTDHNIFSYVSKEKYGKEHPEFFTSYTSDETTFDDVCYMNGLNDDGSVDESKEISVFKIALESLKNFIRTSDSKFFMLGINDANDYCRCERCERAYKKYGERSATVLLFVNALSREIEKWKKEEGIERETNIVIFAYAWCYRPPVRRGSGGYIPYEELKLESNVFVRYCIYTGDRYNQAYGFSDPRQSKTAVENLRAWAAVSENIMIWDYCANYDAYFWYFPALRYMAENVRAYEGIHTQYLMSLSGYTVYREWSTLLRSYVASKLYWNDSLDVYALANEFIDAYHGPFAAYARKFFENFEGRYTELIGGGSLFVAVNDWEGDIGPEVFPAKFLQENIRLLREGIAAVRASALSEEEKQMYERRFALAMLIPQFMLLRNYDACGLKDKAAFFAEFEENMRINGLLTPEIKNEFREGWALREMVQDPELVNYYTSHRYKLDCVDLIVNQHMPYERVSKRVRVDIPTLQSWVKELESTVKK